MSHWRKNEYKQVASNIVLQFHGPTLLKLVVLLFDTLYLSDNNEKSIQQMAKDVVSTDISYQNGFTLINCMQQYMDVRNKRERCDLGLRETIQSWRIEFELTGMHNLIILFAVIGCCIFILTIVYHVRYNYDNSPNYNLIKSVQNVENKVDNVGSVD